jgi:Fur family transcriptional regulator, peroxide stress response regulator
MEIGPRKDVAGMSSAVATGSRSPGEVDQWCARFQELCRSRGIRITAQRLAVYRALAEDVSHPTAEALHSKLQAAMSSLSQATVYRILEFFGRERLVRRVSTTAGAGRFDANASRHQHLVCRSCGRMTDYEAKAPAVFHLPSQVIGGFVAEEVDVRIVGLCRDCRLSAPPRRSRGR